MPPFAGAGFVQVRVSVPPPQEREQALQADQPPLMGSAIIGVTVITREGQLIDQSYTGRLSCTRK